MALYYAAFIPSDGVYAVLFPDVLGCNSQGDTLEDAFPMALEALNEHLVLLADDGDPIPTPSSKAMAWEKLQAMYRDFELGNLPDGTELHPILTPNLDARNKRVAVSFSQYKLDMIDRKAQAVGMTRSGFLAAAATAYEIEAR